MIYASCGLHPQVGGLSLHCKSDSKHSIPVNAYMQLEMHHVARFRSNVPSDWALVWSDHLWDR